MARKRYVLPPTKYFGTSMTTVYLYFSFRILDDDSDSDEGTLEQSSEPTNVRRSSRYVHRRCTRRGMGCVCVQKRGVYRKGVSTEEGVCVHRTGMCTGYKCATKEMSFAPFHLDVWTRMHVAHRLIYIFVQDPEADG